MSISLIIIFIISFFLYEDYQFNSYINHKTIKGNIMNIPVNNNAPVFAKNQIQINAPVETVWQVLTNNKEWPIWQKSVTKVIIDNKPIEGTEFKWEADGFTFNSKIHTANEFTAFGWTGKIIGTSAIHNWTFTSKDNTTIVTVEESLQGVLPLIFRSNFQKKLEAGLLKNLHELKNEVENNQN
jgi:uncharacterized membrane protein